MDESADEKAGPKSAGARRQYNGRLGKVEIVINIAVDESLFSVK